MLIAISCIFRPELLRELIKNVVMAVERGEAHRLELLRDILKELIGYEVL